MREDLLDHLRVFDRSYDLHPPLTDPTGVGKLASRTDESLLSNERPFQVAPPQMPKGD